MSSGRASETYAYIGVVFYNALILKENIETLSRKHTHFIMLFRNYKIISNQSSEFMNCFASASSSVYK